MSYEIIFTDTARKQFKKLEKDIQERIIKALERIRIRPEAHIKKLVGYSGYRLRVEEYRIILDIEKEKLIILVIKIGHRKNIYKKL